MLTLSTNFRTLYGDDTEGGGGVLMTQSMLVESSPPVSSLAMSASCVGWTTSQYRPNALITSDTDGTGSDNGGGVVLQDLSDSKFKMICLVSGFFVSGGFHL